MIVVPPPDHDPIGFCNAYEVFANIYGESFGVAADLRRMAERALPKLIATLGASSDEVSRMRAVLARRGDA